MSAIHETMEVIEVVGDPYCLTKMLCLIGVLLKSVGLWFLVSAKVTLLIQILWYQNYAGISGQTQFLYSIVFTTRFLDLISSYYIDPTSCYLTKIILLFMSYSITFLLYFSKKSCQREYDNFKKLDILVLSSLVLCQLVNHGTDIINVFRAFSVFLEAMVIIPQLYFCSKAKKIEKTIYNYIILLTLYKSFHLLSEVYNYFYVESNFDRIAVAAGAIQLIFYCDFFTREQSDYKETMNRDVETGNEHQPENHDVHPKESEAMRSAAAPATGYSCDVVLLPSMLVLGEDKVNAATPANMKQEERY